MPFGISQLQPDCSTWATVKQETDGTYTTIGCHAVKQDAIDQMVVVSLAEDVEPLGEIRAIDDMTDQMTRALASGDFVSWDSSGGIARGRIDRIITDGEIDIPDSSFTITGTEEDPAALIQIYKEGADGYVATDTFVGHKLSTLTQIDDLVETSRASSRNEDFVAAIDQVMAILADVKSSYESEDVAEPVEEMASIYEMRADVNLDTPEFMRASARRGLKYHEQGLSGDGLMPATVADARRMAAGEPLSASKWRRIPAWIARHIGDLEAVEGDEITAGLVAMLLWGGGSSAASARRAQGYAERITKQLDEQEARADQIRCADADTSTMISQMTDDVAGIEHRWCVTGVDERRIAYTNMEMREMGDGHSLVGYAAVFDSPSEPMPFIEYVKRGAFQKTIKDGADVRLLIDHESVPLARTKSGTLELEEDERGLKVTADLDPNNPDAARVISAMRRGDMSQMSFAFRTIKDAWSDDRSVRELREVQLFDVSVVTFPAYEATVAELRNAQPSSTVASTTSVSVRKAQIALARQR
jgi:HK97 family phage prohead protease